MEESKEMTYGPEVKIINFCPDCGGDLIPYFWREDDEAEYMEYQCECGLHWEVAWSKETGELCSIIPGGKQ